MGTAGGFALVVMSPMPVGKQVFLLGIGAISTVMPRMTPAMTTVKKAAVGGKKSPADAGTKIAALKGPLPSAPKAPPRPSPALPRGVSPFLLCFRRLGGTPSLWEGTEKVPFFYDQNGKCLRFVTSLSANRLK